VLLAEPAHLHERAQDDASDCLDFYADLAEKLDAEQLKPVPGAPGPEDGFLIQVPGDGGRGCAPSIL